MAEFFRWMWVETMAVSFSYMLVFARTSMIGCFCSAILSAVIGYGMAKVVWHAPKLERVVNIISLGCCIIPIVIISYYEYRTWILSRLGFDRYKWFVLLAVLGWRLPYRLMKKSRANAIGIVCLSMARDIVLYAGITFALCVRTYCLNLDILPRSYLEAESQQRLVIVIIGICLFNVGRYFLHPRSTKEIFIDML